MMRRCAFSVVYLVSIAIVVFSMVYADPQVRRFLTVVRLWSKKLDLIDASVGKLNSYTLTLLALFHLQVNIAPALLPPLHHFFDEDTDRGRPGDLAQGSLEQMARFSEIIRDRTVACVKEFQASRSHDSSSSSSPSSDGWIFFKFVAWLHSLVKMWGSRSEDIEESSLAWAPCTWRGTWIQFRVQR